MLPQGAGKAGRAGQPHGSLGDFLALMVRMLSHPEEAEVLLRDSPDTAAQVPITFLVLQYALGKTKATEIYLAIPRLLSHPKAAEPLLREQPDASQVCISQQFAEYFDNSSNHTPGLLVQLVAQSVST